jgi:hypothetical protein
MYTTQPQPGFRPLFWYLPWSLILLLLVGQLRADDAPDPAKVAAAVREQINKVRADAKARELSESDPLVKSAQVFAEYLAKTGKFAHDADGKQPPDRAVAAGYDTQFVAENLFKISGADGLKADETAKKMVEGWLKSEGHRKNLMNPGYYETGVGVARAEDGTYYASQVFGVPKAKQVEFRVTNATPNEVTYTLDGRENKLPPKVTLIHTHGTPPVLVLPQPKGAPESAKPVTLTPKAGDKFKITQTESGALTIG